MGEIKEFEDLSTFDGKSDGYIYCFQAYRKSRLRNYDYLTFKEIIWEHDIPDIVKTLKALGVDKIIFACMYSDVFSSLALFQDLGCTMGKIIKVYDGKDFLGKDLYINGIEIYIN